MQQHAASFEGRFLKLNESVIKYLQIQQAILITTSLCCIFRSRMYRSIKGIGVIKLKSNPNLTKMSFSKISRSFFVTFFLSSFPRRLIILSKSGYISCSSLAAKRRLIRLRLSSFYYSYCVRSIAAKYLSNMLAAINIVSNL